MTWRIDLGHAEKLPLADQSVDLIFGSPPYCDCRTYGIDAQRDCQDWIDWMLPVVRESCRVSRGLVLFVVAGVTRDHCYWPAPEGLLARWWAAGGQCWRPTYWHRVGIPGAGGKQWLAPRIEYVLAFKGSPGPLPWADNTANGHSPKYAEVGGQLSYRTAEGERINASVFGTMRMANGKTETGEQKENRRPMPKLANPGNLLTDDPAGPGCLVDVQVGGGKLGHDLAHENEAPFPLKLAEWFIRSWCPPGGIVLDPFSGSGTTVHAAHNLGRSGIGFDCRLSQVFLGRKRMREVDSAASANQTAA